MTDPRHYLDASTADPARAALGAGTPALATGRVPRAARIALALLERLEHGTLDLQFPDGGSARYGRGGEPRAALTLSDWSVAQAALERGDIGFAEAYIDGRFSTPDLRQLLTLMLANRRQIEQLMFGSWWGTLLARLRHLLLLRNTRSQARRNIAAHYDLGNDFYRLWLDDSMTYSSALFARDGQLPAVQQDLAEAQQRKYRRALDELGLAPGATVLEIGCGWGGLAEVAARERGLNVVGLTLSREQLAFARERAERGGYADRARFELRDYRAEHGRYEGIVSIEMFEAVGEAYWDAYFACLKRNLAPGGRACVQTITIADAHFERYRRSTDFIQQYIFPGGMLPSPSVFRAHARRHGLALVDELAFGPDYAETLARWRAAFLARLPEVRALGYDGRFIRTWEFYLAYCEAAFADGSTDVVQFTLQAAP
jgi:cyclopropane-fatty-acyl-phospholipid synthase